MRYLTPHMPETEVVNVTDVIDRSPIGAFQIWMFVICALCLIMDGFDVQAMGYMLPALSQEWKASSASLGGVLGAGNFGVLIGALTFTMVGDKLGRRPVLIGATLFFSALTLLTARAASVEQLVVLRFIAGIGLGSIMPNATALIGEYSPQRKRVVLMMGITVGFTAGAAVAGFVAAWLIPRFGWRSVFYAGGAIPLIIGALMFPMLPESLQVLVLHGRSRERLIRYLQRIDPRIPSTPSTRYVVHEAAHAGVPVLHLFREGRSNVTLMLWLVYFLNILNLYALSGWLTTVVRSAGYSASTSVLIGTLLQVGGTIGTFGVAWAIGRRGFIPVLTVSFAVACLSIASIGQIIGHTLPLALLAAAVFLAGWCVVGGQPGLNALAATYYPTSLRSTGVGWGLGVGRLGAIVGPMLGGILLGRHWTMEALFLAAAIPALVSAILVFTLRWMIAAPVTRGIHQVVHT
jgi:AAHS family 4-hydroxybenzoate transporter-like MFS transporter